MEGSADSIEFAAKYKNWVAIKKLSIRDDTKPEEVALSLSSIRQTTDKKAFEILGIDTVPLDTYAAKLTEGMRKSYSSLSKALEGLDAKEAKAVAEAACKDKKELTEIANVYLFRKVVQNLKYDFDVNPAVLSKAFPELKVPKPPGRAPKK